MKLLDAAVIEGSAVDLLHIGRNGDLRQLVTVIKGMIADGGQGVGKLHRFQFPEPAEGIAAQPLHALGDDHMGDVPVIVRPGRILVIVIIRHGAGAGDGQGGVIYRPAQGICQGAAILGYRPGVCRQTAQAQAQSQHQRKDSFLHNWFPPFPNSILYYTIPA